MISNSAQLNLKIKKTKNTYINSEISESLKLISSLEGVHIPIAVQPEVHNKSKYAAPTGIVVLSKDFIMPNIVALVPNCGMSLVKTPLDEKDIDEHFCEVLFKKLLARVAIKVSGSHSGLSESDALDIFILGSKWVIERLQLPVEYISHMENGGSMFSKQIPSKKEIKSVMPEVCLKLVKLGLDYMGGGSHFMELQKVQKIYSPQTAEKWDIKQGQIVFLIHSSAGLPGGILNQYFTPDDKVHFSPEYAKFKIRQFQYLFKNQTKNRQFWSFFKGLSKHNSIMKFPAKSSLGEQYIVSNYAMYNFGYVRRLTLIAHMQNAIKETVDAENLDFDLLWDVSHVMIQNENYEGGNFWFHRHGCARAYPSSKLEDGDIFKNTGQPVFLPGSLNTHTYLCVAREGSKEYYYSCCHGSGGKSANSTNTQTDSVFRIFPKVFSGTGRDINYYRKDKYNNVDYVLAELEEENIVSPVAKMIPLAVLKE